MNNIYISAKVSVIIPTKNRCSLLSETVESIRQQTYANWEIIIVDDDSTDATIETMVALSKIEPRVRFFQRTSTQSGAPACRNEGVVFSTGEYIIFLDSDDCLASFCLENRIKTMEKHPDLDFGIFPCQLFSKKPGDTDLLWNIDTQSDDLNRFLSLDAPWGTTSPIWKRQALARLGPWDESILRWQDWDFHVRALILDFNYKKFAGSPDWFWRMASSDRKTVSSKGYTIEQICSSEQLFSKIYSMLCQTQLLDAYRRDLFTKLYFWLAKKWISLGFRKEAMRLWSTYQKKQSSFQGKYYWEGFLYLQISGLPFIKRIVRKYKLIHRSPRLNVQFSNTFKKAPMQNHTYLKIFND